MLYLCKFTVSLMCLITMTACDRSPSPIPATAKAVQDPIAADVEHMTAEIRIASANKRIDELERQVGALQATPIKLDLDLLTSRLEALEAKQNGDAPTSEKIVSDNYKIDRPISRSNDVGKEKLQKPSKLILPELESKPRLATTDEKRLFDRPK